MNKLILNDTDETMFNSFCEEWSRLKNIDLKSLKYKLLNKIRDYKKDNKSVDILCSYHIYNKYKNNNTEPEPEIPEPKIIEKVVEKDIYINLPYFDEWMNIIDKKTKESRFDILRSVSSPDGIRRFMEQQKQDYDEQFPFKKKFIRKSLWLETCEEYRQEMEDRDEYIETLMKLCEDNNIKCPPQEFV